MIAKVPFLLGKSFNAGGYCVTRFYGKWPGELREALRSPRYNPMSKDTRIINMQRIREKLKRKISKLSPDVFSLQVLGCGAPGAARALYVTTSHTKYLFNCSEGTQRLAYEHRCRLTKLEHVFVTTPTWSNFGGLPGVALTIQANGVPELTIHGPKGTADILKAIKKFVSLGDLSVIAATCDELEPYVDNAMTVRYVLLKKSGNELNEPAPIRVLSVDDTDYYAHEVNVYKKARLEKKGNRKCEQVVPVSILGGRIVDSMAYICKLHPRSGKLSLEKCVEKGVTPGPLFGMLKAGKDITLPDGTLVKSEDVCSPSLPGSVFIVVECPSEEYLPSLLNNSEFKGYQVGANEEDVACCVVHFTPSAVINTPEYKSWMEKFPPITKHLLINEDNDGIGSEAVHRQQHKLHLIHPELFPLIDDTGFKIEEPEDSTENAENDGKSVTVKKDEKAETLPSTEKENQLVKIGEASSIHCAKTLHTFHLLPPDGLNTELEPVLQPKAYIQEALESNEFCDALAELQTNIGAMTKSLGTMEPFPMVVVLGTGSCIPNKTRNTSAILLRIDEDRSILLDCGEGTIGQLFRFYGRSKVNHILLTIKAVYVSHLHADHHIGLIGFLKEREKLTKEPVFLLAPQQISAWLPYYHARFELILNNFQLIHNADLTLNYHNVSAKTKMSLYESLGVQNINTVPVKHCPFSFGISLTLGNGQKIVYSGDTMPCEDLVHLGQDCSLLIHEATMEDDLEKEALLKLHSTTSQAINMGHRMNAKFTLLTHFSQRYSKMPRLTGPEGDLDLSNVGIAFDYMQISLSQLPLLPLFYPSLKSLFSEYTELLEERAKKRQYRNNHENFLGQRLEETH
ncbi:ribonuclease Z, mitochondrial [Orussus abietinus]|uniref:ribonuclease Z, mitochondrial n=1 Tax=Orussus abietinus TaxID=222816 RepID=UPI00062571D3|nr:ribonuclease Z, mitochondrial [Orussus abietinus]XP_012284419.1 ribonuclease Z, mitochondrial [Orussus abietinus]